MSATSLGSGAPLSDEERLEESIYGLEKALPHFSASEVLTVRQKLALLGAAAAIILLAAAFPKAVALLALGLLTLGYSSLVGFRIATFVVGLQSSAEIHISDEEALAIPDADLPIYTVLLPAYDEPRIAIDVIDGVGKLNYPRDKLDILICLEADDDVTVNAAQNAPEIAALARIELVPPAEPRTKPKACNWGLQVARGEYTTIYDAEDVPDPLQLRKAVAAFRQVPPNVACLQARLAYHNDRQNLMTRWFSVEYDTWFTNNLPGLAGLGVPLPLGGTSNHLRTDVLLACHGWDAFNVTEDADLGMRLERLGYRSMVLDSVTWEEANSDAINWVKQRSRWNKGYLQTGLIHLRHPRALVRELGWKKTAGIMLLLSGTPLLGMLNAVAWGLSFAWWLGSPGIIATLYPTWLYYPTLIATIVGNLSTIYINLVIAARSERPYLAWCVLVLPFYWVLMAMAATKAMIQLVTNPSYWEKTTHGLNNGP